MAGEWFLVGLTGAWLSVKDPYILVAMIHNKGGIPVSRILASRMSYVSVCESLCVSISSPLPSSQIVWWHMECRRAWYTTVTQFAFADSVLHHHGAH